MLIAARRPQRISVFCTCLRLAVESTTPVPALRTHYIHPINGSPMSSEQMKKNVALAAMEYVTEGTVIGVGTGSTANHFIDALAAAHINLVGAVPSSEATAERLRAAGIDICDLNAEGTLSLYVDGTDEVNSDLQLIKGGGGALTREKIVAAASIKFVCIADASKQVQQLGKFPLPVEVIPMARSYVAREIVQLGGDPELRHRFTTDNGNLILDIHNMDIRDPQTVEQQINQLAGVVCCGLFAQRPADVMLLGQPDGSVTKLNR